tara:strand:+ start:624 stop:2162 length:1539 start_codon:yes stop_codon:yes gene_type:complete
MKKFIILNILISIIVFACKKDIDLSAADNILSFSVENDTLHFNEVFTTVGSATRYLKVYNNDNNDVTINSIKLGEGSLSSFRLNIDGEASHVVNDILLRGQDSLYIFAEVEVNPNESDSEFLETDFISFEYENSIQRVYLSAYGKNAHFHSGIPDYQQYDTENIDSMLLCEFYNMFEGDCPPDQAEISFHYYSIENDVIWENDKPHVIYGDIIIENGAKLTIQAGTSIHLHNDSWLIVAPGGSIELLGEQGEENLIWVQSDRSDSHSLTDYANTPGQWGRILIAPGSINNKIEHAIIKNGKIGVEIIGLNHKPSTLTIKNSIIFNMSNIGILATNSTVNGENLQISNCGLHLLGLWGGEYDFKHCTFANFWPFSRQTPSVFLVNQIDILNDEAHDLIANFGNCIIDGSNENEILISKSENHNFEYTLDHCMVKINTIEWISAQTWNTNTNQSTIILNNNSHNNFVDIEVVPFELGANSNAIDAGAIYIAEEVQYDFNGNYRLPTPDIGCVEK